MVYILFAVAGSITVAAAVALVAILLKRKPRRAAKKQPAQEPGLDLLGKTRPVFSIRLPDNTLWRISTPTMAMATRFRTIGEALQSLAQENDPQAVSELYLCAALLLNRNLDRMQTTAVQLQKLLTLDDCCNIFTAYMDWLQGLVQSGN